MTDLPEKSPSPPPADPAAKPAATASEAPVKSDPWAFLTTPIHPRQTIVKHVRGRLLAGLLWAIPLFITIAVVGFIYRLVTTFTREPAEWMVKRFSGELQLSPHMTQLRDYLVEPTIAVLISVAVVYFLGLLGGFVVGRRLLAAGENFIANLPLIKGIYSTTKQVISVFRQGAGGQSFQRVVLVQFPREGTWTIGFVTKTITDTASGEVFTCVFIPMTPNPTSGFFQMFPASAIRETDWTVDQGIKIVLSGGLLAPNELQFDRKISTASQETP